MPPPTIRTAPSVPRSDGFAADKKEQEQTIFAKRWERCMGNASFNLLVRVVSSGRQGTNNVFAKLLSCEAKFTLEYSKFDVDMIFEV